jgi:hypothetical protein
MFSVKINTAIIIILIREACSEKVAIGAGGGNGIRPLGLGDA